MNIAVWVFTIITGITGFVQNFWQFIALRLSLAVGEGQHFAPSMRMIANWFPRSEKGRATGFFSTTWAVAPAIVPILVTQLAAGFFDGAWRPVFFILAIPGFLCIWLLKKYVSDSPKAMFEMGKVTKEEHDMITSSIDVQASEHGKTYSSKMYATDVQFYLYTAGLVIMLMIYWGMTTWISTFLVKQHGMNLKTMGFYASLPYIVAFFAMYIGGWMADKWFHGRPKVVTIISLIGCIPALYFIGHVSKGDTNMLLMGLAVGGFFINLAWGMMYSFPSLRYPKEVVGRAVGVSNGVGQFGAFVSPMIAGYLVVTLPDKSYDFGNVFLFWSALAFVGAIAISFLKEKSIVDFGSFESQKGAAMEKK
jgi:sugar phosphate permease